MTSHRVRGGLLQLFRDLIGRPFEGHQSPYEGVAKNYPPIRWDINDSKGALSCTNTPLDPIEERGLIISHHGDHLPDTLAILII